MFRPASEQIVTTHLIYETSIQTCGSQVYQNTTHVTASAQRIQVSGLLDSVTSQTTVSQAVDCDSGVLSHDDPHM